MKLTAFVLVEMQRGNFEGLYALPDGDRLLSIAADLLARARKAQVEIAYVQNIGGAGQPDDPMSTGFRFPDSIAPVEGDIVVQKRTPDAFHHTGLHNALRLKAIKRLVVMGLQTEYAIDTSVRRAYSLGYTTILVADGHSTWPTELLSVEQIVAHHNHIFGDCFAEVTPATDVVFRDPLETQPE